MKEVKAETLRNSSKGLKKAIIYVLENIVKRFVVELISSEAFNRDIYTSNPHTINYEFFLLRSNLK